MVIIIDASLAIKWYLLEHSTPEALALLDKFAGQITVPDIFVTEVMGALVRRANIDKALRPQSEDSIGQFTGLFTDGLMAVKHINPIQMATATNLALNLGHPLKDCIYLALAMELGCDLVTCDAKFAEKAKVVWAGVRVLGE